MFPSKHKSNSLNLYYIVLTYGLNRFQSLNGFRFKFLVSTGSEQSIIKFFLCRIWSSYPKELIRFTLISLGFSLEASVKVLKIFEMIVYVLEYETVCSTRHRIPWVPSQGCNILINLIKNVLVLTNFPLEIEIPLLGQVLPSLWPIRSLIVKVITSEVGQ